MAKTQQYVCPNLSLPFLPLWDDPAWQQATEASLLDVESGKQPFLATSFRILRDDDQQALFVCFVGEDDQVVSTFRMHQETLYRQDVFELFIADGKDLLHYKEIEVSPYDRHFTGTIEYQTDSQRVLNLDWNMPGFVTQTHFDKSALKTTSLWRLPYGAFATKPIPGHSWRFNAFRVDHSKRGESLQAWQPTGQRNFHVPKCFGQLIFQ